MVDGRYAWLRPLVARRVEQVRVAGRRSLSRLQSYRKVCASEVSHSRCRNEQMGRRCPLRHLVDCHPERIALLYRYGRMTEYEACAWMLYPCSDKEVNPFGNPHEKLCYDYLNTHVCKRNQEGNICRFRHCLPRHADALKDRLKNEKKVK